MKKSKFLECVDELNFKNFKRINKGLSLEKYKGEFDSQQAILRIFSDDNYYGDRYLREKVALQNLSQIDNDQLLFPKLLNFNDENKCLIVSWIKGETIKPTLNKFRITNFIEKYQFVFNNYTPKIVPGINLINDLRDHLFVLPVKKNELSYHFRKLISNLFNNINFENNKVNLIHGDLNYNNIIMREDGRIGIIDWEYSSFGSTNYDVAYLLVSLDKSGLLMKYPKLQKWISLVYAVNAHWFLHFKPTGQNCKKWINLLENSIEFII